MRMEKRISRPARTGVSSSKTTPLAETFRVRAAISPLPEVRITGRAIGNRTAHRTSCRLEAGRARAEESGNADFKASINGIPGPEWAILTLPNFSCKLHVTKVSEQVTHVTLSCGHKARFLPTGIQQSGSWKRLSKPQAEERPSNLAGSVKGTMRAARSLQFLFGPAPALLTRPSARRQARQEASAFKKVKQDGVIHSANVSIKLGI